MPEFGHFALKIHLHGPILKRIESAFSVEAFATFAGCRVDKNGKAASMDGKLRLAKSKVVNKIILSFSLNKMYLQQIDNTHLETTDGYPKLKSPSLYRMV